MGAVALGPEAERAAQAVADYAARPENWYRVSADLRPVDGWVPGDRPGHVLLNGTTRVVFSFLQVEGRERPFRYMTVSTTASGGLPNPVAVFTLAHMLGFTGAEADGAGVVLRPSRTWGLDLNRIERTVVVQEEVLDS